MKTIALAALAFVLSASTLAADDVFSTPLSDRTRPEVTAVAQRMAGRTIIKASFTQSKTIASLKRTIRSRGRMLFDAGRGLVWETVSPFPGALLMTKDAIKQKTMSGKISVLAAGDNDTFQRFAGIMQAVFNGDLASIERDFAVFFTGSAKGAWTIGLKPKDKTVASVIQSLEIRGRIDLEGLLLHEASGDTVTYVFTDAVYPAALSPADEKAFF